MSPGLLEDPSSKVWQGHNKPRGWIYLSGLSKHLGSSLSTLKELDRMHFRFLAAIYDRSITARFSAHIFFLLCFPTQNYCRRELSKSSIQQNFLVKMFLFFLTKTIVKKKTVSVIHIFQLCHVCNNCNGNLIHPLIKTIWEITSPNFFTRENIFVSMWKTWWQSQQWSWYHVSWKLKDVPKACRGEMATKLNTYVLCKMYSSVFSPGKKQFIVQMGFLIPSWWYLHASLPSLPPFLPPCLGTGNLLGFKSFSARRNSERRKTAGKHIHASWKGMRLKYYCEAQHHFPKISHSLK